MSNWSNCNISNSVFKYIIKAEIDKSSKKQLYFTNYIYLVIDRNELLDLKE